MDKLRAIIVDDEESARDVLENLLLRFCPEVEVVAKAPDLPKAVEQINQQMPQLVFLDIEMPQYAGYEIVKFIDPIDFAIVFVTAYDQYAVRAFELSAMDYLLKPIDIERLRAAVKKVHNHYSLAEQAERLSLINNTLEENVIKSIAITEKGQQHIISLDNIIAIEAQESYCLIHTVGGKKYTASKNIKHFELLLESVKRFIRCHKSWIINKDHLNFYSKSENLIYMNGGVVAKLSKYKKGDFKDALMG